MKVALVQMPVGANKTENVRYACARIAEAARIGIDMAILPEMFCCPYSNQFFREFSEPDGGEAQTALSNLARELDLYIVGGSMPELCDGRVYNTSYVFDPDGARIAKHRKAHLFDVDIKNGQRFMESETLSAGDAITTFDTPYGKFGLCICYDFRFEEMARVMALRGARMIIVPAAFNMTTGPAHWETLFRQRAVDNQLFTIGVAPARNVKADYVSYGNSIVVSPWGEVIARCGGAESLQIVEIDLTQVDDIRRQLPIMASRRADLYGAQDKKD